MKIPRYSIQGKIDYYTLELIGMPFPMQNSKASPPIFIEKAIRDLF